MTNQIILTKNESKQLFNALREYKRISGLFFLTEKTIESIAKNLGYRLN